MSEQLSNAITLVLSMPYFRNDAVRSAENVKGHEEMVARQFSKAGFSEYDCSADFRKKGRTPFKTLKEWARTKDETNLRIIARDMPLGSYALQPAGTQSYPDILVRDFNDKFHAIECKSSKGGNIMWNDSLPFPNGIYVFSSQKYDSTTVFMGRDVITCEELELRAEMTKKLKLLVDEYETMSRRIDKFSRGWKFNFRQQNFQSSPKERRDYFLHADRESCEKKVLEYVSE
jgi:hypothetical protein